MMVRYSFKQNKKLKKLVSWATLLLYLGQPAFVAAQAVADPSAAANNKPTIESTANGLPMVQIAAPSAAGVSRNLYQQFDIGTRGLILNNANAVTNTQLAGYVYGNPNLTNGQARIILNEVTGSSISQLNGYLEVAGQKAQVIIANPNGIAVNGFGFINTSRGVLTTGIPLFGGSGSLDAFRVTGGQISVQGAGLDASTTDRAELISRTVSANAGIWAKDLSVVTGSNKVDYETLATEKLAQPDEGAAVALDVGALGGMYANKIKLIGTEKGVGVNSQGTIAASGGNMTLTNEGKVILAGNTSASGNVALHTNDSVLNQGTVYAQGNTTITAAGALINTGVLAAGQDTALQAQSIMSAGTLGAGIKTDGTIGNTGNLTLASQGAITAQGQTLAGGSLTETGTAIDHSGAVTYAGGNANITATAGDVVNSGGSMEAKGSLTLTAAGSLQNDKDTAGKAGQISAGTLKLTANSLSNKGGSIEQTGTDSTAITVTDAIDNTGGSMATNGASLNIKANDIGNTQGQIQHAGTGTLTLAANGILTNTTGSIVSNGQLAIETQNTANTQGTITAKQQVTMNVNELTSVKGTVTSGDVLNIKAQGSIDNRQGTIEGAKGLQLAAQSLINDSGSITNLSGSDTNITVAQQIQNQAGLIGGNGNVAIAGKSINNQGGKLTAQGKLTVNAREGIDNAAGTILSGEGSTLQLLGGNLTNTGGTISTGGNLSIEALDIENTGGSLLASQDSNLVARNLSGNGRILAGNDLALILTGDLSNAAGGELSANRDLKITATGIIANQGNITGVQGVTINTTALTNATDAAILAGKNLNLLATGKVENKGRIGGSAVNLTGQTIDNSGTVTADELTVKAENITNSTSAARLQSNKDMSLQTTAAGGIMNKGTLYAQGKMAVSTSGTVENTGTVAAGQDTNISALAINSTGTLAAGIKSDGSLGNTGNLTLLASGSLTAQGKNLAGGNLIETGTAIDHSGAITYAGGNATLTAAGGDIDNTGGVLQAGGKINLTVAGTLKNDKSSDGTAGQIAGEQVRIVANNISNQGGTILQTGTVDTNITVSGNLDNTAGILATNGSNLTLKANAVNNTQGRIQHAGTGRLELESSNKEWNNRQGILTTNGQLTLTAGTLTNTGGTIAANKAITIASSSVINDQGTILTQDVLALTAQSDISNRQGLMEAGKQFTLSAVNLDNQGGSMTSLDTSSLTLTASGTVNNTAGTIGSNGDVSLTALTLTNTSGKILSGKNLTGNIAHTLDNLDGKITAGQDITLGQTVPMETLNNGAQGSITAGGNLVIAANHVDNQGNLLANQDITITSGSINEGGSAIAGRDMTLTVSGSLNQQAGGEFAANRNMNINAASLSSQGNIIAVQDLTIAAHDVTNATGAKLAAGQTLTVTGDKLTNQGTVSGSNLRVTAKEIDNSGSIVADSLQLKADTLANHGSQASIRANQTNDFSIANAIDNTDGALLYNAANNALTLSTGTLTNTGSILSGGDVNVAVNDFTSTGAIGAGVNSDGTLGTVGNLTITSTGKLTGKGRNLAARDITMSGKAIDLSGAKTAAGNTITMEATNGNIDNTGGVLQAGDTIDLKAAGKLTNDNAAMQAKQVKLKGNSLSNVGGKILQTGTGDTVIKTAVIDNTGGTIATNGNSLTLEADVLTNKQGSIINAGTGSLTLTTPGKLDNTGGTVRGNGTVEVAAATLDNTQGTIAGQQGLQFSGSALTNDQGAMVTKGAMNLKVQNLVSNRQGLVEAERGLTVTAQGIDNQGGSMTSLDNSGLVLNASQTIDNTSGTIGANGDVTLTSVSLSNRAGKVLSKGNIYADVSQTMDNASGKITAEQDVTLGRNAAVGSVNNTQGSITAGASLLTKAITFDNTNGNLAANQDLNYTVNTLTGTGSLIAGQDLTINLAGDFTYASGENLTANRDLTLHVANLTNNGKLSAVRNLKLSAGNVSNGAKATLEGGEGLTIAATGDMSNSGTLQGGTVNVTGRNITNTGAVFGNTITMTADTIVNNGDKAVLAANQNINLYAKTSLENKDGANIYSSGSINIAGSSNADKTNNIINQSATIEADGDINISANNLINKKRVLLTEQTIVSDDNYNIVSTNDGYYFIYLDYCPPEYQISLVNTGSSLVGTFLTGKTITETKVTQDSPVGKIISGKNMTIGTDILTNDNSWIIASGTLNTSGSVSNIATGNTRIITRHLVDAASIDPISYVFRAVHVNKYYDDIIVEQLPGETALLGGGKQVNINGNVKNITILPGVVATGSTSKMTSSGYANTVDSIKGSGNSSDTINVHPANTIIGVAEKNVLTGNVQKLDTTGQKKDNSSVQNNGSVSNSTITINTKTGSTELNASNVELKNMQPLLPTVTENSVVSLKQNADCNITLPTNAMFKTHTEPEAKYLIETDSRFTSYSNFVSSDYMMQKLNIDPAKTMKRLGDGFYEQKLVREQIAELTGRYTLSGYSSAEDQYKSLLNNGATYAKQFNLQVGIALTPEQMAQLTSDIVWLVEKEVNGQKVLVPEVYLAKVHSYDLQNTGAIIAADNVQIKTTGDVNNIGTIKANNSLEIDAVNIANYSGKIDGGNLTKLSTTQDLLNINGLINGGQVQINAGQDVSNIGGLFKGEQIQIDAGRDVISKTNSFLDNRSILTSKTTADSIASINATKSIVINTGRDISLVGSNVNAGQDISFKVGQNLNIDSVKTEERTAVGSYLDDKVKNITTNINAGGSIALIANGDATFKGAQVNAGKDLTLVSGGNIDVEAVKDEKIHDQTVGISHGWMRTRNDDETVIATNLQGTGNVTVAAIHLPESSNISQDSGHITILGSNVNSKAGNVTIAASKDVNIQEVSEKHESLVQTHTKRSGFFSSTTKDTRDYSLVNQVKGSTVSGDSVKVTANNDVNVVASNIVGTNDVNLTAGNDVNIVSAKETGKDEHYSKTRTSGIFGGGGFGITIGSKSETTNLKEQTLDEIGSTIGSIKGNVNVNAGNKVNSAGTTLVSGKDLNITGKAVNIDNTVNTYDSQYKYEFKQSGLTVSLGGGIVTTAVDAASSINRSGDVSDSRLKALYDYKAYRDINDIKNKIEDKADLKNGVTIGVSIGSSKTTSEQTVHMETVNVSNVNAGGNVNVKATEGDVNLTGTKINAKDISIEAVKNINIAGAQNKEQVGTKTNSSSVSVGVSVGLSTKSVLGGFGNFSKSSGKENENATTNVSSVITASGTTILKSGEDTNIIASKVNGDKVVADVGGNLNIASKQDTNDYTAKSSSIGAGFGTNQIGGTTASINKGKTDSTYASVKEQAGIYAGKEGFDINVGKNTDLKGAVISSEAPAVKNALKTGDLTIANLENRAQYQSSSIGVNYNAGKDINGKDVATKDKGFTPNPGMPASGDASSTTQSAISPGTIVVRNNPNQDLSGLSRDTSASLNALGQIFDKKTVQERQELAKVFGEVAYKAIGDLALDQYKKAIEDKAKYKEGTQEYQEAVARAASWDEGGANKILLHTVAGGIMSDLGGSGFTSGAVSAGVNELVQKQLSNIKDPALHQIASAIVGAAASKLIGGNAQAGASTAASATKNNWLTHEQQYAFELKLAKALDSKDVSSIHDVLAEYYALSNYKSQHGLSGEGDDERIEKELYPLLDCLISEENKEWLNHGLNYTLDKIINTNPEMFQLANEYRTKLEQNHLPESQYSSESSPIQKALDAINQFKQKNAEENYQFALKMAERDLQMEGKTPDNTLNYEELVQERANIWISAQDSVMGSVGGGGFKTFKELKTFLGSPGVGNQWHHIVEQAQQNASRSGFAAEEINTVENIIALQSGKDSVHSAISGLYSSKPYWAGGLTVRDWLATKSFEEQFEFGMNVLKQYGTVAKDSVGRWVFNPFE